jgi:HlyD family secretion protein
MQSRVSRLIPERKFWPVIAVWATLSALFLASVSGCGRNAATAGGEPSSTVETLAVSTTTPRLETIRRSIVQPGFIKAYEETPIYTKIAGFLETVNVDIGDKIKKGQLLGELWVPEVAEDVTVKKKKIAQAEANVVLAKEALKVADANIKTWDSKVDEAGKGLERANADCERWKYEYEVDLKSIKTKIVLDDQTLQEALNQYKAAQATLGEAAAKLAYAKASQSESIAKRDKAKADVQVNDEQLRVSEKEWEVQKDWFAYAKITAPYDGVVTHRYVHTGHFVQASNSGSTSKSAEPLFTVMRTDEMRIVVQVPESDAPLVKDGADAIVRVQSLRNREVHGTVTRSSWSLDMESRTLRVEIFLKNPLENPKEELQAGMYVTVSIIADLPNAMALPVDSILIDGTQTYCYMMEDGMAKRVNVQVGVQNDRWIQLLLKQKRSTKEGEESEWVKFTGTERVIVSNITSIRDGQPVTMK